MKKSRERIYRINMKTANKQGFHKHDWQRIGHSLLLIEIAKMQLFNLAFE